MIAVVAIDIGNYRLSVCLSSLLSSSSSSLSYRIIIIMAVGLTATQAPLPSFHTRPQQTVESFDDLVIALKEALGPSSGLDSKDVDVNTLARTLREYNAKEMGWAPYAMADPDMNYTRNLVDEGNGKSNLVRHLT